MNGKTKVQAEISNGVCVCVVGVGVGDKPSLKQG